MLLNPNHSAFPCPATADNEHAEGLTVREYFAVQVLQGLCAHCGMNCNEETQAGVRRLLAREAVLAANALVEELNRPKAAE